jgi:hypothetical protein
MSCSRGAIIAISAAAGADTDVAFAATGAGDVHRDVARRAVRNTLAVPDTVHPQDLRSLDPPHLNNVCVTQSIGAHKVVPTAWHTSMLCEFFVAQIIPFLLKSLQVMRFT